MKEYTIVKKTDWENVPEIEIAEKMLVDFTEDVRAYAKICYDSENLYVRLRAVEKDIRAEEEGYYAMPCEDSCLEFFFSPDNNSKQYFNIEMNPKCTMFLGTATSIKDLLRLVLEKRDGVDDEATVKDPGFEPVSEKTADGWQLTYKVPFEFIRRFFPDFAPKSGDFMMANAYKCGEKTKVEHYLAWNRVDPTVKCCFHNPDCFGKMIFG